MRGLVFIVLFLFSFFCLGKQSGNLLTKDIRKSLLSTLQTYQITVVSGRRGAIKIKISNLRITAVNGDRSYTKVTSPSSVRWVVRNLRVDGMFDWWFAHRRPWFTYSDKGRGSFKAKKVGWKIPININKTILSPGSCRRSSGSVSAKLQGTREAWFYRPVRRIVEKHLRNRLANYMCKAAKQVASRDGRSLFMFTANRLNK